MATKAGFSGWWDQAACQSADPELFFPLSAGRIGLGEIDLAKAICARCSIRQRCLDYALDTSEAYGVWGGASEEERRVITARRRRLAAQVG